MWGRRESSPGSSTSHHSSQLPTLPPTLPPIFPPPSRTSSTIPPLQGRSSVSPGPHCSCCCPKDGAGCNSPAASETADEPCITRAAVVARAAGGERRVGEGQHISSGAWPAGERRPAPDCAARVPCGTSGRGLPPLWSAAGGREEGGESEDIGEVMEGGGNERRSRRGLSRSSASSNWLQQGWQWDAGTHGMLGLMGCWDSWDAGTHARALGLWAGHSRDTSHHCGLVCSRLTPMYQPSHPRHLHHPNIHTFAACSTCVSSCGQASSGPPTPPASGPAAVEPLFGTAARAARVLACHRQGQPAPARNREGETQGRVEEYKASVEYPTRVEYHTSVKYPTRHADASPSTPIFRCHSLRARHGRRLHFTLSEPAPHITSNALTPGCDPSAPSILTPKP